MEMDSLNELVTDVKKLEKHFSDEMKIIMSKYKLIDDINVELIKTEMPGIKYFTFHIKVII